MKYLITGSKGKLAYDIKRELINLGLSDDILALDKDEMDIVDEDRVNKIINYYQPDIIFHCAAWTDEDSAELNLESCYNVNVVGTRNVVNASKKCNSKIVYISTSGIFDGKKNGLYSETDIPNPKNFIGFTKYLGELEVMNNPKHFIVRTTKLFGINGQDFAKSMLEYAENKMEVLVDDSQRISPTYTVDLAKIIIEMVNTEKYGIYNITNSGYCSLARFADYLYRVNDFDIVVRKSSVEKSLFMNNAATITTLLDQSKLVSSGFDLLPDWEEAVERFTLELKPWKKGLPDNYNDK